MKAQTHVTISKASQGFNCESQSTHIFNTKEEAHKFVSWIQTYNADLNITIKESSNVPDESPTFI